MNNHYLTPKDNYERNFNMVKHFCGKSFVLFLIILIFINIISTIYITFSSNGSFELLLINVAFSKLNLDVNTFSYNSTVDLINVFSCSFFAYSLMRIYIKSKNEDPSVSPETNIYMLYLFTMGVLVLYALTFFLLFVLIFTVLFADPKSMNFLPELLKMTPEEITEKKISIVMIMVAIEIALIFSLWFIQAQGDFLKSIRTSLTNSLPKNKGAHTFGTFSIIIGIVLLSFGAVIIFLYYCYKEAFAGLGYKISDIYVFVGIVLCIVRGLIPIFIGIIAYSYSNLVDDTKTHGTLYTDFGIIGEAVDPNSQRRSSSSSSNKFIR